MYCEALRDWRALEARRGLGRVQLASVLQARDWHRDQGHTLGDRRSGQKALGDEQKERDETMNKEEFVERCRVQFAGRCSDCMLTVGSAIASVKDVLGAIPETAVIDILLHPDKGGSLEKQDTKADLIGERLEIAFLDVVFPLWKAKNRESWNSWPLLALQTDEFVPVLRNGVPQVDYHENGKRVGTVGPGGACQLIDGYHGSYSALSALSEKIRALIAQDMKLEASCQPLVVCLSERFGFVDKNGILFVLADVHRYGTVIVAPDGSVVGVIRKNVAENGASSFIVYNTAAMHTACVDPGSLRRQAALFAKWAAFGAGESVLPKFKEERLVDIPGFPGWLLCVDAIRNQFCIMHNGRVVGEFSPRFKLDSVLREIPPEGLLKAAVETVKWRYFGAIE